MYVQLVKCRSVILTGTLGRCNNFSFFKPASRPPRKVKLGKQLIIIELFKILWEGSGTDLNLGVHLPLLTSTPCDPKLTYKNSELFHARRILSYFMPGLLWAQGNGGLCGSLLGNWHTGMGRALDWLEVWILAGPVKVCAPGRVTLMPWVQLCRDERRKHLTDHNLFCLK